MWQELGGLEWDEQCRRPVEALVVARELKDATDLQLAKATVKNLTRAVAVMMTQAVARAERRGKNDSKDLPCSPRNGRTEWDEGVEGLVFALASDCGQKTQDPEEGNGEDDSGVCVEVMGQLLAQEEAAVSAEDEDEGGWGRNRVQRIRQQIENLKVLRCTCLRRRTCWRDVFAVYVLSS